MKVFSYSQYIKCIHTFRLNAVMQLAEQNKTYQLEVIESKYSPNRLIKNILQNKAEVTKFINEFIRPREQIKETELVKYTNHYLTKKYDSKKLEVIYKLKNQEVFFLIEHQSSVDNNMAYKILNYCLDIMRDWNRNKKMGKSVKYYPIIVPIVIYTGDEKWKISKNVKEKQYSDYALERYKLDMEYNFVDINKISKQMLLEQDTMFGYAMFLEKAQNSTQLAQYIDIIIKTTKDKTKLEELANIIRYLLQRVLDKKVKQELIEEMNKKVGEQTMSTLLDRLVTEGVRDIQRGKRQGKKESQLKIARNMINLKVDEKIILETTEIEKEKLEEIKKELATAS